MPRDLDLDPIELVRCVYCHDAVAAEDAFPVLDEGLICRKCEADEAEGLARIEAGRMPPLWHDTVREFEE
jgi:hypothetical protein